MPANFSSFRPIRRSGFSMVEMVVSLGVVSLLLAIIVPAVQSAREAARRVQCTSNLKQIALAWHEHESMHSVFPGPARPGDGEPWPIRILPFLEEIKPRIESSVVKGGSEVVEMFSCPSDPHALARFWKSQNSYNDNEGSGMNQHDGFGGGGETGLEAIHAADVTDGLSLTMMLSERLQVPVDRELLNEVAFSDPMYEHRLIHNLEHFYPGIDEFAHNCQHNSTAPPIAPGKKSGVTTVQTPNRRSCFNGPWPQGAHYRALTASSLHPGGVNVAFGDGAVRFVSDSVDRRIWRAWGTRDGSEAADLPSF